MTRVRNWKPGKPKLVRPPRAYSCLMYVRTWFGVYRIGGKRL